MAEGILKKLLPQKYRPKIKVISAGTAGISFAPATPYAIEVAEEKGIDIRQHASREITQGLLQKSQLILVMARDHERYLRSRFPQFGENVFLIKTFDRNSLALDDVDIQDPIGRSKSFYRKIFQEIEKELRRILPRILKLVDAYFANAAERG